MKANLGRLGSFTERAVPFNTTSLIKDLLLMYLIRYKKPLNVQNKIHFYLLNAIIDIILSKDPKYADLLTMQLHYQTLQNAPFGNFCVSYATFS
jgi:hypothetical protein